ncbi:ets DNA-binding protein pokkuri isoform X2 [Sitodiplosis mosellana]|nr:ets DNA-binding protein pokkuri isoform X2 [Sitodiplosis mosellana]XP_055296022.1 ets DNA-binding protein pokkuri isoform X2 [Sitodiplosis mosellana]
MKLLPIPLPPLGAPPPIGMFAQDLLWRYPAPSSPLAELKTQLPPQLPTDPRVWNRDDVAIFLQFCEREFDLPKFEMDLFLMNGKALCLLTKNDLAERIPGAGDVLHNVLQMLVKESQMMHKNLPNSPITPTSRYHPFSPHSQPPTPNWSILAPPDSPFHPAHIQHLMQSNSVTLSPAPSVDSQGRSPPQQEMLQQQAQAFQQNASTSAGSSNQSDSDEDSYSEKPQITVDQHQSSPPLTPLCKDASASLSLSQQISNVVSSWSMHHQDNFGSSSGLSSGSSSAPTTPCNFAPVKREFFPDTPEPNTNGRLLWDFLQQLLNDAAQRYSNFIAWKCRETGVFKIVDPAGLAKLWGIQKNHLSMNYDKMSRALRYYYRVNILRKVQGERHCYQFLRNPTELKSIKNISLLRQQPPPAPASSNQTLNNKVNESSNNNGNSNGTTQMGAHLNVQSLLHQQAPPSSPRVHALNGAFHYLTTSTVPDRSSPPQSHSSSQSDMDDQPTDLSTSGRTSNPDCYPLIRNSNGLTTIRLIQPHSPQSQHMDDYPSHHSDKGDRTSPMATDLRKME